MESILVEIELPGVNETRDFLFPAHIPIGALLEELVHTVAGGMNNALVDPDHPMLLNKASRQLLNEEKTLAENGVLDGTRLMLI